MIIFKFLKTVQEYKCILWYYYIQFIQNLWQNCPFYIFGKRQITVPKDRVGTAFKHYFQKGVLPLTVLHSTYHSRASECLQNIRGTDLLVVFVLILFPQMSNILLLNSVLLAQPQISNKIVCPYYPYVVLYIS